jgi:hypothetical protein
LFRRDPNLAERGLEVADAKADQGRRRAHEQSVISCNSLR